MPTQQLAVPVAVTSDGSGAARFVFPSVTPSLVYTGTVAVAGAPPASLIGATVGVAQGGLDWGQWNGAVRFGPIQALGGQTLVVTAVGLVPLTQYTCSWLGTSTDEAATTIIGPSAFVAPNTQISNRPLITAQDGDLLPANASGTQLYGPFFVGNYESLFLSTFGPINPGDGYQVVFLFASDPALFRLPPLTAHILKSGQQWNIFYDPLIPIVGGGFGFGFSDVVTVAGPWMLVAIVGNRAGVPGRVPVHAFDIIPIASKPSPADLTGVAVLYPFTTAGTAVLAAGANARAILATISGGPWQVTVGQTALTGWDLIFQEMDYLGVVTPLAYASLRQDGAPVSSKYKTETIVLSQAQQLLTIVNRGPAASAFTLGVVPAP